MMLAKLKREMMKNQTLLLGAVTIIVVIGVTLVNPKFISMSNITAILQQVSVLGIVTMGMAFLLIGGGVDLAVGNIMVLAAIIMGVTINAGTGLLTAIICGVATGTLCGAAEGAIISKSRCIPLIVTLGTQLMFYGVGLMITGGKFISFGGAFDSLSRIRLFGIVPIMVFVLFGVVILVYILLEKTRFGRRTVAIGGNERNAYLSGINIDRHKIRMYTVNGFIDSIAAIVLIGRLDSITPSAAGNYALNAVAAAIIGGVTFDGGKGTIGGAFMGVLFIGIINNAMNILGIWSYAQSAISGAIIVGAVVLSNVGAISGKK